MMKTKRPEVAIVGAGLAGLIAAHAWPEAMILEAAPGPVATHQALLRFRSEAVAHLTGIEFRRVRVRKGIWYDGDFRAPSIRFANWYAQKSMGPAGLAAGDRSIWNLDPVERFIAPDDFYDRLVDRVRSRIHYGHRADFEGHAEAMAAGRAGPFVSTAPLSVVLGALNMLPGDPDLSFQRASITVERWTIPGADLYQTIYFPDPATRVYRASMTGSTLIVEHAGDIVDSWGIGDFSMVLDAFGLIDVDPQSAGAVEQKFGKIVDLPAARRKAILFKLTHDYGIYSLGRFATWRNILLDDVVKDIGVIKRLMEGDAYDLRRTATA